MSQTKYWKKIEESPEHQAYIQFHRKHYGRKGKPEKIITIPLIGLKKTKSAFKINSYYEKSFFLFEPDTPPMEKVSLDKAIEEDFRFLGQIPNICWGITRTPGHSISTYNYYGVDELFIAFERFFKKKQKQNPPRYFGLKVHGSRPYGDNPLNWEFAVNSPLYTLTFFGER